MDSQTSIGDYLGVPIDFQSTKVQQFTPLLDKISKRITSWNHFHLSQPAKILIINSILIGAIMNQLGIFQIPATIANKIDSMLAMFFWKDAQGKGVHWEKRDIIQRPRGQGGLGIRNIGIFNKALLMKKAWRIKQHPHLLLSQVYQRSSSLIISLESSHPRSSWGRKGIHLANTLLSQHTKWKVGDGTRLGVTTHLWMNGSRPIFLR